MNKHVRPAIVVFLGSNCERDMEQVLRDIYQLDPVYISHTATELPPSVTHVILPGGFSFGDYLRAGALAKITPIMKAIKEQAYAGLPILGVCNGFQILCEANLLPGVLLKNHHDRFVCSVESVTWFGARKKLQCPRALRLPIAHREGRYYADAATIATLQSTGHVALIYDDADDVGNATVNGARSCIAGIVAGPKRNIVGMMPHPERMADSTMLGDDGHIILEDFLFG